MTLMRLHSHGLLTDEHTKLTEIRTQRNQEGLFLQDQQLKCRRPRVAKKRPKNCLAQQGHKYQDLMHPKISLAHLEKIILIFLSGIILSLLAFLGEMVISQSQKHTDKIDMYSLKQWYPTVRTFENLSPRTELPISSKGGDHKAMAIVLGITRIREPLTPDLAGKPTLNGYKICN